MHAEAAGPAQPARGSVWAAAEQLCGVAARIQTQLSDCRNLCLVCRVLLLTLIKHFNNHTVSEIPEIYCYLPSDFKTNFLILKIFKVCIDILKIYIVKLVKHTLVEMYAETS